MAAVQHLLILLALFCGLAATAISKERTDSDKNCANSCAKTFPSEKSNTVDKLSDACQRGCRFFELVNSALQLATNDVQNDPQLLLKSAEDAAKHNNSKETCQASCMEAYKHTRERYACHEGCANMARENSRSEEKRRQALLEEHARELASLAAVGPLLTRVFNQLYPGQPRWAVMVSTSDDGDGPHSEDVILLEQTQEQQLFVHNSDSEPDDVLTDPALLRQLEASSSFDIAVRLPEQHVRTFPAQEHAPRYVHSHPPAHPHAHTGPSDWLGCIAGRSGLPKWLLGALALLTGILTAWLCLEPWDRAVILEENSEKHLLIDTEDDVKIPLSDNPVKLPLESEKV